MKAEMPNLIVYGANCVWWDSPSKAGRTEPVAIANAPTSIPCCPHCKSPLFQLEEEAWWASVDRLDRKNPGYRQLIEWSRGRCFKTIAAAVVAWRAERGAPTDAAQKVEQASPELEAFYRESLEAVAKLAREKYGDKPTVRHMTIAFSKAVGMFIAACYPNERDIMRAEAIMNIDQAVKDYAQGAPSPMTRQ